MLSLGYAARLTATYLATIPEPAGSRRRVFVFYLLTFRRPVLGDRAAATDRPPRYARKLLKAFVLISGVADSAAETSHVNLKFAT
jgi:hypothetical protein